MEKMYCRHCDKIVNSSHLIGVKFTLKNNTFDWYDPVDYENGYSEDETDIHVDTGFFDYIIPKKDIIKIEFYKLCEICEHELEKE